MSVSPRIVAVRPLPGKRLEARFENGATRVYDCTPLLAEPIFAALADDALFRAVHVDPGDTEWHGTTVLTWPKRNSGSVGRR